MSTSKNPQKEVKERVWKTLTAGLDLENDILGCIDDIRDNTSYAIDVAIYETANAILNDLEKADDSLKCELLGWFKKTWLVPVPVPAPEPELTVPEISMGEWIEVTPTGKKAKKGVKEIFRSIEGMRISNRGNVGIGSGKSKRNRSSIDEQKKKKGRG